MKRIILGVLAVGFTLTTIGFVYSEPPLAAAPKTGKALVKKLPDGIEGVELAGNTVRVKAGYKFVKRDNGTVTVARMAGGGKGGLSGGWSCSCDGGGTCSIMTSGGVLYCTKGGTDTCKGSCKLSVSTSGFSGGVIRY